MSVINKMLRDLDQQHGMRRSDGVALPAASEGLTRGTVPLKGFVQPGRSHLRRWFGLAAIALLLGVIVTWYVFSYRATAKPEVLVKATISPVTLPASAQIAAVGVPSAKELPASKPSTGTMGQGSVALMPGKLVQKAVPAVVSVKSEAPSVASAPEPQMLRMEAKLNRPTKPSQTPQSQIIQGSSLGLANGSLEQAQSVRDRGSYAAAITLLQQRLTQLESSATSATPVVNASEMAEVARELAHKQMAEGQVSQALATLTRLEPHLSQIAEVWALRGSAAQRLGQHVQAAKSYSQALLLKPDEPRWMVGQAVSLAAMGQTLPAGELAEKARTMGALQPEVAAYLKQLGVALGSD